MAALKSRQDDVRRLRLGLSLFFLALALPTGFLVYQAYTRLKWESVYQHRQLAEDLAKRIDRRVSAIMDVEEARGFAEYGFLTLAGQPAANFLQRSPLSAFPLDARIPGLLGYFQIDTQGRFSTPLLPGDTARSGDYGVAASELKQRRQLSRQLRDILARNQLVRPPASGKLSGRRQSGALPEAEQRRAADLLEERAAGLSAGVAREEPRLPATSLQDSSASAGQVEFDAPQAAFDRLREQKQEKKVPRSLGRVEDLKFSEKLAASRDQDKLKRPARAPAGTNTTRVKRKEQSALPELATPLAKSDAEDARGDETSPPRVSIFESEIDPFDISLLDSGHLVLFRKVWRDGQRYIQGALLEPKPFIEGLMANAFRESSLARMSELVVAYQGNVFSAFNGGDYRDPFGSGDELRGALLYQTRLSAPLGELEMIFTITRLPVGPGAQVVVWLSGILLLVLCGGFVLMYRLGHGQIRLAHQQQDFVSAVSHELKTPLTSIRMYGEMLREGWAGEEKKATYYQYIHDESERLSRLIENVLQLARMTRNDLKIELRAYRVATLMDTLRSKIGSQIERAGYALHMDCAPGAMALEIPVDADYFAQIMINLVDNALKFSVRAEHRCIDLACQVSPAGQVVFSVRDYGPGVAREQMKKIFQLFYRAGNELTRETVGTGIGLALVKQLAQAMDAKVDVVNREPGAEFRLVFAPGR